MTSTLIRTKRSAAPTKRPARTMPVQPVRTPQKAAEEPRRLCIVHGLESPSGGPVLAVATGHPRRQAMRVVASIGAALAALSEGGAR